CGNPQWYDKPLKQRGFLSRQGEHSSRYWCQKDSVFAPKRAAWTRRRNTSPDGLALSGDGTIVIGATMLPRPVSAAGTDPRPVFLPLRADGRPANPAVTLLGTVGSLAGLAPARDGTIVAAGFGDTAIARRFLVVRLRSDGVLDPDFGGGAVLVGLRASLWQG